MGAVFSMCPHLFLYPVFCILAGNLLASGHKKEFGLSPDIPNPRLFLTNLLSTIPVSYTHLTLPTICSV